MMKRRLETFIEHFENLRISLFQAIIAFLAIVFSRAFLEGIFEEHHTIGLHPVTEISIYNFFLHFPVYFLFVFLTSLILLYILAKERIEKIGKIVLSFFPIILLPPLLDLLITHGKGESLIYLLKIPDLFKTLYGTFLFPIALRGVSYGIRIEVLFACLLAVTYVFIKTNKVYKSLLSFFGIYLILLFSGSLPLLAGVLLSLFKNSGVSAYFLIFQSGGFIPTETQRVTLVFLLPLLLLVPLCFWLWSPSKFKALLRNMKWFLSLHFIGMVSLGIFLSFTLTKAAGLQFIFNPLDYVAILALFVAIFLVHQSTVLFEGVSDIYQNQEIKKKSVLTPHEISIIGTLLFIAGVVIALSITYVCFLLIGAFALVFFFYIYPPFRLKRFFPISTFLLSLASLIAVISGFSLFTGEKAAFVFPSRISLLVLVVFTLAFSLKDLSTMVFDKKMKMFTIPSIFGEEKGKKIIAFILLLSFLTVPLILKSYILFFPAILLGFCAALVILRKRLRKEMIAIFYILFAILVLVSIYKNREYMMLNNNSSLLATREYYIANSFMEKGLIDKAATRYESALRKGYATANIHHKIGLLYLKKGEVKKSIIALRNSLSLEHNSPETKVLLAQAYIREGKPDTAIIICNNAIKEGRYKAEFYMFKGEAFLTRGAMTEALKAFERSILLGEDTGKSAAAMGDIYLSLDSLDKAIELYTQALNCNKQSHILKQRAEAYYRVGTLNNSLSDLKSALHIDPEDPEANNNIGILYYEKANYSRALEYLTSAIALDNQYIIAYENLTNVYERMGLYKEAALTKLKMQEIKNSGKINNFSKKRRNL